MSSSEIPYITRMSPHDAPMTSCFVLVGKSVQWSLLSGEAKADALVSPFAKKEMAAQGAYICDSWCTGTLDKCVGSHTKLAIYPALAICCQRVVICASLDTRFKGMQVVTYQANVKQLKFGSNHSVSENPGNSPEVHMCSPFIVPSQNSMRDHCDVIS